MDFTYPESFTCLISYIKKGYSSRFIQNIQVLTGMTSYSNISDKDIQLNTIEIYGINILPEGQISIWFCFINIQSIITYRYKQMSVRNPHIANKVAIILKTTLNVGYISEIGCLRQQKTYIFFKLAYDDLCRVDNVYIITNRLINYLRCHMFIC